MRYRPVRPCRLLANVLLLDYLTPRCRAAGAGTGRHQGDIRAESANGGGNMKQHVTGALLATGIALAVSAAMALALVPTAGASATGTGPGSAAHSAGGGARETLAPGGPSTWHVLIGGHAGGQAIQAEGYYPH